MTVNKVSGVGRGRAVHWVTPLFDAKMAEHEQIVLKVTTINTRVSGNQVRGYDV